MPRDVHNWTEDKLKILRDYLPGYLGATTRAIDRIYVDGFAGPGRNRVIERKEVVDGSPLIALNAVAKNGTKFTKLYFIEADPETANELRSVLTEHDPQKRADVITGDVNKVLPTLMRERINPRAPTFVFLDTEGIDPRWTTLEAISPWRTELLVNFPLGMSINRNAASRKVIQYFGTEDCLPLLEDFRSGRTRRLLDMYKDRLREIGYTYPLEEERLVKRTKDGVPLYYLLFASKVDIAKTIMRWVFSQADARGQRKLL